MFRTCVWNVLADAYLRRDRYPYATDTDLDRRAERIAQRCAVLADGLEVLGLVECESHTADAVVDALGTDWRAHWVKRPGRPDGSLVAARLATEPNFSGYTVPTGDLAVARVTLASAIAVSVVHLSWSAPDAETHPVDVQIDALVTLDNSQEVIAGDFNSAPGGRVESRFVAAGWQVAYPGEATAHFGHGRQTIDGVAARGVAISEVVVDGDSAQPLPRHPEPSDHLPVKFVISDR